MAGRPLRNAMIDVLRKRTADWFGDNLHTSLDYALEWVENGGTIQHMIYELARDISEQAEQFNLPKPTPILSRSMLTSYLESLDPQSGNVASKLTRARSIGAHAMVERANVALDAPPANKLDRDTLNVLDRRLAAKERLAAAWNRADFGKTAGVSVAINVADLHLAALQHHARVISSETLALSAGVGDADNVATGQEKTPQDTGRNAGTQIATVGKKP